MSMPPMSPGRVPTTKPGFFARIWKSIKKYIPTVVKTIITSLLPFLIKTAISAMTPNKKAPEQPQGSLVPIEVEHEDG